MATTYEVTTTEKRIALRNDYDEALTIFYDCILQTHIIGKKSYFRYPNGVILRKIFTPAVEK
jgi:hypothetical protein